MCCIAIILLASCLQGNDLGHGGCAAMPSDWDGLIFLQGPHEAAESVKHRAERGRWGRTGSTSDSVVQQDAGGESRPLLGCVCLARDAEMITNKGFLKGVLHTKVRRDLRHGGCAAMPSDWDGLHFACRSPHEAAARASNAEQKGGKDRVHIRLFSTDAGGESRPLLGCVRVLQEQTVC